MVEQGIDRDQIEVWMDDKGMGNLFSCMNCFEEYGKRGKGRWHMQDDVCIASDFKEKTEKYDEGQVAGFFRADWQALQPRSGRVPAVYMWNSFQCIRIPDDWAAECAEWFFTDAAYRDMYQEIIADNKGDDSFYYDFICERHLDAYVLNLDPSIVEHIDHLIGGSVINEWRGHLPTGHLWQDKESYEKLKIKLAARK